MEYFPHTTARQTQKEFMDFLAEALMNKKSVLIHAPTGIGKTAASLSPALGYALKNKKTIFFVTGKHTQHKIALETLSRIKEMYKINIKVADFIGKKWMCLQPGAVEMENNEFSEFCKEHINKKTCTYYENVKTKGQPSYSTQKALTALQENTLNVDQVIRVAQAHHICPYELTAQHAMHANVIIADYFHVLSPHIQDALFKKIEKEIGNTIIIFDEAHNIPDRVRDLLTINTSTQQAEWAAKEARQLGYEEFANTIEEIKKVIEELATNIPLQTHEALLQKHELIDKIKKIQDYDQLVGDLKAIGDQVLEQKRRSSAFGLGKFLEDWNGPDEAFTRVIQRAFTKKGKPNIQITYRCLDPSLIIKPLADQTQLIFMSGTLSPISTFRDILGIDAETKELTDPFPPENKLALVVPEITTKFTHRDDAMYRKIAGYSAAFANAIPGNSVIFFPSYQLRDAILPYFSKLCEKTTFLEQPSSTKQEREELIEKFKTYKDRGACLLGVSNASFGEGIDLPGDYLKGVIIVGLPLAKPDLETQELIRYYDYRFGKGWDYGYTFPALTRTLQNAGRCIRSATDRGVIIFLDDRYNMPQYRKFFPKEWNIQTLQDPIKAVKEFFEK